MSNTNTPIPVEVVERFVLYAHEPNDLDFKRLLSVLSESLEAIAANKAPAKAVMKPAPAELNERLRLPPQTPWLETIAATVDRYTGATQLLAEVRSPQRRAA